MDEVIVRRYEEKDLYELLDMIKRSFLTPALDKIYEKDVKNFWLSEYTKEEILKIANEKHLYVARLNGKIVDYGAVSVDNNMAYLSGVFIDPTQQGKGIGRKVMEISFYD